MSIKDFPRRPILPPPCHMTWNFRDITHLVIPEQYTDYQRRTNPSYNLPKIIGWDRIRETIFNRKRLRKYDKIRKEYYRSSENMHIKIDTLADM